MNTAYLTLLTGKLCSNTVAVRYLYAFAVKLAFAPFSLALKAGGICVCDYLAGGKLFGNAVHKKHKLTFKCA